MSEIHQLNIEGFFTSHGQHLQEVLAQVAGQPPRTPNPPSTLPPASPFVPNPDDFGFYVSFRFDQSLQQTVGPNAWGLYLSESAISNLASYLVSEGCPTSSAWSVAHEFVLNALELEYLADCTLCKWDHLGWLHGHNPDVSRIAIQYLHMLKEVGIHRSRQLLGKARGQNSPEIHAVKTLLRSRMNWMTGYARFFVNFFGNNLNGHVLKNNSYFPIPTLMKTVSNLLVTKPPKKSPIGTALPIHYIP